MRVRRSILLVGAVIGLLGLAVVCFPRRPVLQFMHHDQKYFRDFARACDSLLQQRPLGTNAYIRVPGDDPSLPPVIRDLRYGVDRVIISSNLVLIFVPAPYHGFGITWRPQNETDTNVWTLVTCCESHERLAYAEQR
jgi:hypothetical protein